MARDTREPSPPATTSPASGQSDLSGASGSAQKKYETFDTRPVSANALPAGSGLNTAGSKINNDYTLVDAIKTVRLEDFKQVHMYPCVRESLLTGIGAGFGVGGLRAIFGGELPGLFPTLPTVVKINPANYKLHSANSKGGKLGCGLVHDPFNRQL